MSSEVNPLYLNHLSRILPYIEDPEVEEIAINNAGKPLPPDQAHKAVPASLGAKFADEADGAEDLRQETAAIEEEPHEPTIIWRKMRGSAEWQGIEAPDIGFRYLDQLTRIVANINHMDYSPTRTPICYAQLPGSIGEHRFTQVGGPHVRFDTRDTEGWAACIRQGSRQRRVTLSDYQRGTMVKMSGKPTIEAPEWAMPVLEAMYDGKAIVLLGLMGSGKTSIMGAFTNYLPDNKRVVSIEDTREVQVAQSNRAMLWISRNDPVNDVDDDAMVKVVKRFTGEVLVFGEMSADRGRVVREMLGVGGQSFMFSQHSVTPVDGYRDLMMFFKAGGESDSILHDVIQANVGYFVHIGQGQDGKRVITGLLTPKEVVDEVRKTDRGGWGA